MVGPGLGSLSCDDCPMISYFIKCLFVTYRSPDGYSLFACSLDGTVATFHFEALELGNRLTDAELEELKRSRYGDVRGRQANLAESPAQLLLEAASAKQTSSKVTSEVQQKPMDVKASVNSSSVAKVSEPLVDDATKNGAAAAATTAASADGLSKPPAPPRISSPVKQREYRRPDGRKRIIPEAVGVPSQQQNISGNSHLDFPLVSSDQRNDDNAVAVPSEGRLGGVSIRGIPSGILELKDRSGATARSTVTDSLVIEKVLASASGDGIVNVESSVTARLMIRVFENKEGGDNTPFCLEACPRERAVNDIVGTVNTLTMKETEVTCTRGVQTLWTDRISGKVTVLAGNANFWAVGCEDGCLQVHSCTT